MTEARQSEDRRSSKRTRLIVLLSAVVGLGLFLGANAHLLHVAFTSQPDCVPHSKTAQDGEEDNYRAAKSAC